MKLGDTLENAVWLTGAEPPKMREDFERRVRESFVDEAHKRGFVLSPLLFHVKRPGEDRVPDVPDHITGPDVRLLVAECRIVARLPELKPNSFLGDLDPVDLDRLRAITRNAHRQDNPKAPGLTDAECDRVIEEIGPEAALDAVRRAVDSQTIH